MSKMHQSEAPDAVEVAYSALGTPTHSTPTDKEICQIVGKAHHDLLFASGNKAYKMLWKELHDMKYVSHLLFKFYKCILSLPEH
jgi:hypothetical protein